MGLIVHCSQDAALPDEIVHSIVQLFLDIDVFSSKMWYKGFLDTNRARGEIARGRIEKTRELGGHE